MKMSRVLGLLATAILLATVGVNRLHATPQKLPPGKGKFFVVLWEPGTPIPGAAAPGRTKKVDEPDFAGLGGEVLSKNGTRRVVILPLGVVKQLRKHEAVMYVQRIWNGESEHEWAVPEDSSGFRVETNSDEDLQWGPRSYTYDGSGNITAAGTDQYRYDSAGRLIQSTVHTRANGSDVSVTETFSYDAFGNLTGKQTGSASAVEIPVDPSSNRLNGVEYDVAGNAVTASRGTYWGTRVYKYDALNSMTTVRQGSYERRMIYDVSDERIGTIIDDNLSRWSIRDLEGRVLREYQQDSYVSPGIMSWLWAQDYVYGENALVGGESQKFEYTATSGKFTFGGVRHYHLDHLGSVRMATDDEGRSVSEHDYAPFGMTLSKTYQEETYPGRHIDAMRFAGHQRDFLGWMNVDNSEYLDYMHARYYDPNLGRFLSVDQGAPNLRRPQSWNRYSYAHNNPIKYVDPDGNIPVETVIDVASLGASVYSMATAPSWANLGYLAWDAASVALPYVPGSWVAKVGKYGHRGLQAMGVVGKLDALESAVNNSLVREGVALLGQGDDSVKQVLGLSRADSAADFLGVTKGGTFKIVEAKGSNVGDAVGQIAATAAALKGKVGGGVSFTAEIALKKGQQITGDYRVVGNHLQRFNSGSNKWERVLVDGNQVTVRYY